MVFRKVWFCGFLFFFFSTEVVFYCVSVADIPGETVKQTALPYVPSERRMVL